MKQITVQNKSNLKLISYKQLTELQGNFKILSQESLEKLIQSILVYGFMFPAFVWRDKDKTWIIDAHGRVKALRALESRGYIIPEIPYVEIYAENKKDAVERLLHLNSQYGKINPDTSLFSDYEIDIDSLNVDFGDIEFSPNFEETGSDDQSDLDELEEKLVKCPFCKKEFDAREQI